MTCSCIARLFHTWRDWVDVGGYLVFLTWLTRMWHDSFEHMWHDSSMWDTETQVLYLCIVWEHTMCNMTHSCVPWLIHVCHDSFMCDMTHSCVTWLIHMWCDSFTCDRTHSYVTWLIHVRHSSSVCMFGGYLVFVTWLNHMWHDSTIRDMTYKYVTWLVCMWHGVFVCDIT